MSKEEIVLKRLKDTLYVLTRKNVTNLDVQITYMVEDCIKVIEKQQKELEQEKEKNKKLKIELEIRSYCKVDELSKDLVYYKELCNSYQANSISKDKIRAEIEEIKNTCYYNEGDATAVEQVFVLEKLLEK